MSIVRVKHNRENPYVMINREALWDKNMSLEAVGLWTRLLSRPDDWKISAIELAKSNCCGIKKIYSLLQELIENGYASRSQEMPKGHKGFGKVLYEVYEFKNILTLGHLARSVSTRSVGGHTTNKGSNQVLKETNNPPLPPPNPPLPPTKEEEEELQKRFKERPKDARRIACRKKWEEKVLKDIRIDSRAKEDASKAISQRKLLAAEWDGKKFNGMDVVVSPQYVEFTHGSFSRLVRYDVSEEEWRIKTGWQ